MDATGGSDANTGTSPSAPWKTLAKVWNHSYSPGFAPGDSILLKRGQVWREAMEGFASSGAAGSPITIDAYGTGANPIVQGSRDLSAATKWVSQGSNIWRYAAPTGIGKDVGLLIFNNEAAYGVKKDSAAKLTTQGDFYYDFVGDYVNLYSTSNPGLFYSHIEGTIQRTMWFFDGQSYVTMRNLTLQYGGWIALSVANGCHHLTFEYLNIRWIGGAYPSKDTLRRDGNAFETWGSVSDIVFRYNRVDNIWEGGFSIQDNRGGKTAARIYAYGNVFSRIGAQALEYWLVGSGDTADSIYFCQNTVYDVGHCFDAVNKPSVQYSVPYILYAGATATNSKIANNIFHTSPQLANTIWDASVNLSGWDIDYNCYYPTGQDTFNWHWADWLSFSEWKSTSGKDAHGINVNPLFVSTGSDFRLQSGSPCLGRGAVIAGVGQTPGVTPNIGAY